MFFSTFLCTVKNSSYDKRNVWICLFFFFLRYIDKSHRFTFCYDFWCLFFVPFVIFYFCFVLSLRFTFSIKFALSIRCFVIQNLEKQCAKQKPIFRFEQMNFVYSIIIVIDKIFLTKNKNRCIFGSLRTVVCVCNFIIFLEVGAWTLLLEGFRYFFLPWTKIHFINLVWFFLDEKKNLAISNEIKVGVNFLAIETLHPFLTILIVHNVTNDWKFIVSSFVCRCHCCFTFPVFCCCCCLNVVSMENRMIINHKITLSTSKKNNKTCVTKTFLFWKLRPKYHPFSIVFSFSLWIFIHSCYFTLDRLFWFGYTSSSNVILILFYTVYNLHITIILFDLEYKIQCTMSFDHLLWFISHWF